MYDTTSSTQSVLACYWLIHTSVQSGYRLRYIGHVPVVVDNANQSINQSMHLFQVKNP